MKNFTRVKFWLLLMVMGLMVSSAVAQEPKLTITPDPLNLGEWPIGGWQENAYLELNVEGNSTITINASELDDADGVFTLTNPNLPVTVAAIDPAVMVGVAFTGEGVNEQTYTATYVASWGANKSVTTSDVVVYGYTPVAGDIFELPFDVTLPHTNAGVSTGFPMRSNYNTPGTATNGKDVVYKFTLAEDKELNVTVSNASETPKMAIYAADFDGEAGPMVSNSLVSGGATLTDVPLYAGDYYLVVAAETEDAAMTFDIDINASTMPAPECIVNPIPADGAVEVASNGIVLEWTFGQFTQEYQVSYGTQYPPTDFTSDWMTADAAGEQGTFALPNLDPSMQYFWVVNVKNNNATVESCDVYGFTTTLTPPANLTATVIEIAEDEYNVKLDWTASAKALLSYNVYRDATLIGTTPAGTNTYTDLDLAYNTNPCYVYTVEAIFDEGVSELSNEATACITGVGTLNGTVTELLTGDAIEGATVSVVSQTGGSSYTYTADVDGDYTGEVLEDCYTITVSMDGYITEVLEDVCVDYNTTVTEDFQLDEYPYPVSDVVATELDDFTVQVDWGNNGNPGGGDPVEFRYDDGIATGQLGSGAGTTNTLLGNVHRVDAELTEMSWYLTAEGGPHATISIYVLGLDAAGIPDGNNVLFTESVSNTDEVWNTYTFDTPIDATGGFFLGVGYNGFAAIGTDDGTDDPYVFEPNTHYFVGDYTAGGWETWETYDFEVNGMIRAMGVEGGKASYAVSILDTKPNSDLTYIASESFFPGFPEYKTVAKSADKDLLGYNVYRGSCYSEDDFEFLGYTLDDQFTDNTWNDVDWGVYRWAVEAVYTNNTSERAYSNCIDKLMETTVAVEVTTNSGDAPEGCVINFFNTSEPDAGWDQEIILDATGMGSVDPFRKGMYDYTVVLPGFGELSATDVLIDTDTTFVWQLEELLAPPSDLYVTPTGFATWGGGGAVPFEPFMADFNENLDGWEVINNGTAPDYTWFWNNGSNGQYAETLDGTPYAFVDSDDAGSGETLDEYLVSPVINTAGLSEVILEFDQYYRHLSGGEYANVDVFDGSDWVNVLNQTDDYGDWDAPDHVVLDVTAYANADFRVRFHYFDDGGWKWHWAVDNVTVHDNSGKYASDKAFQFYKVWHDDVFSADADTNFYQYGTNTVVDILVPGETYLAEVATLYSTGLSARIDYTWTYLPCDSFPGPGVMDAFNPEGSDDVVVVWGDEVAGGDMYEDFEGGATPEGWEIEVTNTVTSGPVPAHWTVNDYADADGNIAPIDTYHAGLWWDYGHQDEWLITPEVPCGANTTLNFSTAVYEGSTNGDHYYVKVSTDGGSTWTAVWDASDLSGAAWNYYAYDYNIDLSAYSGQNIKVAFNAVDGDGQGLWYVWFVDNVTIGSSKGSFKFAGNELKAVSKSTSAHAKDGKVYTTLATKAAKADPVALGTNVYRDGELIAYVPAPDTFYLDMDLEAGYYDYCVATVYTEDGGDHTWTSCIDGNCVMDVLVPEDCDAPSNLTAEDLMGDGHTATLNWQYAVTGTGEFFEDFESGAIPTDWAIYDEDGDGYNWEPSVEFNAHSGVGCLYSASYINGVGALNPDNYLVSPAIEVSSTSELSFWYVGQDPSYAAEVFKVMVSTGGNTPADFTEIADGVASGDYQEMVVDLSAYAGETVHIAIRHTDVTDMFYLNIDDFKVTNTVSKAAFTASATPASVIPFKTEGMTQDEIDAAMAAYQANYTAGTRVLEGTNVYRDGEFVAFVAAPATTYADLLDEAGYHCYEVTGVYSVCGESDPSNEACVDVSVGINDVENNVAVYPNPAKDFVMVEASNDIRSIEVTNYMGQVVSAVKSVEMTQYRVNTSDLSSGVYFVEVETTAGIETVRIVISE